MGPRLEVKSVDIDQTVITSSIINTPSMYCLNPTQTGSGFFNRIGNRIAMKTLHVMGYVYNNKLNTVVAPEDVIRVVVFYDRQANGGQPLSTDVFQGQIQTTPNVFSFGSFTPINMVNKERFLILRDERIYTPAVGMLGVPPSTIQLNSETNTGPHRWLINMFIKLKDLETIYKASSSPSTFADITSGSLWLMIYANNSVASANPWSFACTSRLKFIDT